MTKTTRKTKTEKNIKMDVAGCLWTISTVTLTQDIEGDFGITALEYKKIHDSIAIEIFNKDGSLTFKEFDFLCSISDTMYTDAATVIRVNKSTISHWKKATENNSKNALSYADSVLLKNFFWKKLFEDNRSSFIDQLADIKKYAEEKRLIKIKVEEYPLSA